MNTKKINLAVLSCLLFINCFQVLASSVEEARLAIEKGYKVSEGRDIACVDFSRGESRVRYRDKGETVCLNPMKQWEKLSSRDPNIQEDYTRYTLIEVRSEESRFLIVSKGSWSVFRLET